MKLKLTSKWWVHAHCVAVEDSRLNPTSIVLPESVLRKPQLLCTTIAIPSEIKSLEPSLAIGADFLAQAFEHRANGDFLEYAVPLEGQKLMEKGEYLIYVPAILAVVDLCGSNEALPAQTAPQPDGILDLGEAMGDCLIGASQHLLARDLSDVPAKPV